MALCSPRIFAWKRHNELVKEEKCFSPLSTDVLSGTYFQVVFIIRVHPKSWKKFKSKRKDLSFHESVQNIKVCEAMGVTTPFVIGKEYRVLVLSSLIQDNRLKTKRIQYLSDGMDILYVAVWTYNIFSTGP